LPRPKSKASRINKKKAASLMIQPPFSTQGNLI